MIYSVVINNVQFEAYYDKEKNALYILDTMTNTTKKAARKSLTNGIDNLIPALENVMRIKSDYSLYLYGTDNYISRYDMQDRKFHFISEDNPNVFYEFKEK